MYSNTHLDKYIAMPLSYDIDPSEHIEYGSGHMVFALDICSI